MRSWLNGFPLPAVAYPDGPGSKPAVSGSCRFHVVAPHGCGSKSRCQHGLPWWKHGCQNLRNPSWLILSHTHIGFAPHASFLFTSTAEKPKSSRSQAKTRNRACTRCIGATRNRARECLAGIRSDQIQTRTIAAGERYALKFKATWNKGLFQQEYTNKSS